MSRLNNVSVFTSLGAYLSQQALHPRELYKVLGYYYTQNGLYDALNNLGVNVGTDTLGRRPFRNPANRVVEFYANKLWPGSVEDAFILTADNERIIKPIQQVWAWSNMAVLKQVLARWYALYGDLFIKVVQTEDRAHVYQQGIEAQYVSDFDADERDYLTYIRIDQPMTKRVGDDIRSFTRTEVWDKAAGSYRVWEHAKTADTPLDQLGVAAQAEEMSAFGIDFLPFVRAKFRDIGEDRGVGCFTHCLDKIDEANQLATRLHQLLFRHGGPVWAVAANALDKEGRPMPAPIFGVPTILRGGQENDRGEIEIGDDKMLRLPGNSTLQALVPTLDYASALNILNAQMEELARDLPELAYYSLREKGELSGRAVRLLLSDAVAKAEEARGSAVNAFVRANQMALTIAQGAGVEGFTGLGTFEAGDFDHTIALPEIVPLDETEESSAMMARNSAYKMGVDAGLPLEIQLQRAGWSEDEMAELAAAKQSADAAQTVTLGAALARAQRQMDQGQNVVPGVGG